MESKPVESMEVESNTVPNSEPVLPEVKQENDVKQEAPIKQEAPAVQEEPIKQETPAVQEEPIKQEVKVEDDKPQITPLSAICTAQHHA